MHATYQEYLSMMLRMIRQYKQHKLPEIKFARKEAKCMIVLRQINA